MKNYLFFRLFYAMGDVIVVTYGYAAQAYHYLRVIPQNVCLT